MYLPGIIFIRSGCVKSIAYKVVSVVIFYTWERFPLRKGEMPMQYVTYDSLIQIGLFIVALIGLVYKISHKDKK